MATIYNNDKGFKIIKLTIEDSIKLNFGLYPGVCLCMHCNEEICDDFYYIAALNDAMCEDCFNEWYKNATHYTEDIPYENRYFEFYAKELKLI